MWGVGRGGERSRAPFTHHKYKSAISENYGQLTKAKLKLLTIGASIKHYETIK
jgi:hypothetical protein